MIKEILDKEIPCYIIQKEKLRIRCIYTNERIQDEVLMISSIPVSINNLISFLDHIDKRKESENIKIREVDNKATCVYCGKRVREGYVFDRTKNHHCFEVLHLDCVEEFIDSVYVGDKYMNKKIIDNI